MALKLSDNEPCNRELSYFRNWVLLKLKVLSMVIQHHGNVAPMAAKVRIYGQLVIKTTRRRGQT